MQNFAISKLVVSTILDPENAKKCFFRKIVFFLNHEKKQANMVLSSYILVKYGWIWLKKYKEQTFLYIILAVMLTQSDNHRKRY